MPLVPIDLPQGVYKNGTPYARRNRWENSNLVRWHDGAIRAVGGWQRLQLINNTEYAPLYSDASAEAVRDIFAWRKLDETQQVLFGSNCNLYYLDNDGLTQVTTLNVPNIVKTEKDPETVSGYGRGSFGQGVYGSSSGFSNNVTQPVRWSFSNFGEIPLFCQINQEDAPLRELDLTDMSVNNVANAPTGAQAVLVTDQRQVLVLGGDQQPRRVQLSDIEDRTSWTPATDNQVIDRTLTGTGKLLNATNVLRQVLIIGENDAFAMEYIGPPYVVSIELVGENCGLLSTQALANTDKFCVWWGERNFWLYDGSVQILNCDVLEFLYETRNPVMDAKIYTVTNTDYSEIWWFYQSFDTPNDEVDSYVAWDYRDNTWSTGQLRRTAGIDKGVLDHQLFINRTGILHAHELPHILPPNDDIFAETGILDTQNGNQNVAIRYVFADTNGDEDVNITLYGRQTPNGEEYTYGPYMQNNPTPTRAIGRSMRMRVDFLNADTEIGSFRLDVQPTGGFR